MPKLTLAFMVLLLALGTSTVARAQDTAQSHSEHHPEAQAAAPASPAQGTEMMAKCRQMMVQQDDMMKSMQTRMNARLETADKKLDALVAEMNKAKGNDKVEAMAKVVTEIAAQRKGMPQEMMQMQQEMMSNMMERMQNAAACPMMQGMMQGMKEGMTPGMRGGNPAPAK